MRQLQVVELHQGKNFSLSLMLVLNLITMVATHIYPKLPAPSDFNYCFRLSLYDSLYYNV